VEREYLDYEPRGTEANISILDVVPTENLEEKGGQLQGPHPLHGSDQTGMNFTVNPEKNTWFCHHQPGHYCGGGPFEYIAMEEGIIECGEWDRGESPLKGKKWTEAIEAALDRNLITTDQAKELAGNKEREQKEIETSKVESEGFLAEQVATEDGVAFVYLDDGEVRVEKEIQMGDEVYVPRHDEAVKTKSVLLPSGIEDYESTKRLVNEIRNLIHEYVDVSEGYEKLASWYVVTTWVYDELSTLSYLRALGDTGTGKSRLLDVVGRMCYKPIIVSGAVTPAPIYRLLEQWKGTLIIDEGDLRKSDAMNEVVTILNCGFERGRPVIRCVKDNPEEIRFHRTFGPKLIATRQEFNDKALESRCLTEKMTQTSRDIPDQLPEEFFEKAEEIRNKLLKWRLENKDNVDLSQSRAINMGNIEPRLKQATRGFLAVFQDTEIRKELLNFLKNHQKELIEQRAQTWEGMVINVIYDKWREEKETLDEGVNLWPKKIAEEIGEKYGEERITAARVGKILRGMNLETERKRIYVEESEERRRLRVLKWEEDKLEDLFKRYVPGFADFQLAGTGGTDGTGWTDSPGLSQISKLSEYAFHGREKREDKKTPSHLSTLSNLSQVQREILDFMDEGVAYSHYDIADEFALSDEEAKGRLGSLYDKGYVKKKRGGDGTPYYARLGGDKR